jgi:hypothetical protein
MPNAEPSARIVPPEFEQHHNRTPELADKTTPPARPFLFLIGILTILSLSDCVDEQTHGDTKVFSYELWVPIVVILAGLAALPLSRVVPWRFRRYRIGLPILSVVACVLFAPSLYLERVSVAPTGFVVRTGFWGLTSVHKVQFDQLSKIEITKEVSVDLKGRSHIHFFLLCEKRTGEPDKVPFNTTVTREAVATVLQSASSAGIVVIDTTR